jgi:neutral ceramidase
MKNNRMGGSAVWICLIASVINAEAAEAVPKSATCRVGFAERDISPKIGDEQPASYMKAFHRSFHDACKVRAVVFDDGERRVALVGVDALLLHHKTVAAIREGVTSRSGIPPQNILIAASHSHAAGPTGFVYPGEFDDAEEFVKKLAYEYTTAANKEYLQKLETAAIDAICEADARRTDARCAVGSGQAENVAFNRRFRMQSGLTATHPGEGNPAIVEPAGPTDPQVGVVGAWNSEGRLLGCVVNFACHATTVPGGISADYVYYIEKTIRGLFGEDVVVVFLAGAAGDVTQGHNLTPFQIKQSGEAVSRFVGGTVGAEAIKVLTSLQQFTGNEMPLAAVSKTLSIKRRVPRVERVAQCRELAMTDPKTIDDLTDWAFAKEIVLLDARIKKQPTVDVEVQVVQVGPAVFCTTPAEYFCQLGLDIKQGSHFPFTFPVSLANGCCGYVPTEEAFGPRGGGYETRLTSYSNLEPSAGRQMADALIALAKGLNPGPIPKPPALPEFKGNGWAAGIVPPELD